jgi:hypothetical protein
MLDALGEEQNLTVDLQGNPLTCKCEHLDFARWLFDTRINLYNRKELTCRDTSQALYTMSSLDINALHSKCFPNTTKIIVSSVVGTFVANVILCIVMIAYCKRWRLKYWWYITRKSWQQLTSSAEEKNAFEYDAFVAYDYDDFAWVKNNLLEEMENKRNFKLCIHHRDFPAGYLLEEIIVDRIGKSRKTILLLTPKFIQSEWCEFEYSMARNQLFRNGRDVIIAVILRPLRADSINRRLRTLLEKKLYIEWVDNDPDGQELFWRKLNDALTPYEQI